MEVSVEAGAVRSEFVYGERSRLETVVGGGGESIGLKGEMDFIVGL